MTISSGMDFESVSMNLSGRELLEQRQNMDRVRENIGMNPDEDAELREACEGFEAIFISKLWKQMRDSVPKDGYLHGKQEEQYLSMFDQAFAEEMTSAGGIGLADMLYRQLQEEREQASLYTSPSSARDLPPIRALRPELVQALGPETGSDDDPLYTPLDGEGEFAESSLYEPVEGVEEMGPAARPAMQAADPDPDLGQGTGDLDLYGRPETDSEEIQAGTPGFPLLDVEGQVQTSGEDPERISLMGRVNELARAIETRLGSPGSTPTPDVEELLSAVSAMPVGDAGPMPSLQWPTDGQVSSHFGWRIDPFTAKRAFHSGVDLAGEMGDPVRSCWDGRVIFAGDRGNYGHMVVVEHANGWRSYYGHNSENLVRAGDMVTAGQEIAKMGSSGRSTGPHLHFELRQGELAWDPEQIQDRLLAGYTIGR